MSQNFECPNCGYIMSKDERECKYCGTNNPSYVSQSKTVSSVKEMINQAIIPTKNTTPSATISPKSRIVCAILQIFFGAFGVGRFYSGHVGIAILQILVTFFTAGVGSIWGFLDGILILLNTNFKDSKGRIMK